ncbi:MAG: transposase [Flavobacteriales bacterium]|nr:IS1 family transposase [Bacteroidales bacterium AH-315-I05]PCJ87074.1 MAG: transposase [Flavobacteriales bacterium]
MKCKYCSSRCVRKGFQRNGTQKYQCKHCKKYQQRAYKYQAYHYQISQWIKALLKEGNGILSISRLLGISKCTVSKRILFLATQIKRPAFILMHKEYEMDELRTYIGRKTRQYWIAYAIQKDTREVIDFKVGRRNKKTLGKVIDTLLLSQAKKIYTDKCPLYLNLIPKKLHVKQKHKINHIERKNLNLRTHLRRLHRKTICYSKSLLMLIACLKIYFWG